MKFIVHSSLQSKAAKPSAQFFAEQSGKAERTVDSYRMGLKGEIMLIIQYAMQVFSLLLIYRVKTCSIHN